MSGPPTERIEDAEFTEVGDSAAASPAGKPRHDQAPTMLDLWDDLSIPAKFAIAVAPLLALATCGIFVSGVQSSSDSPSAATTDMGAFIAGASYADKAIYIDDLPSDAPSDCGGKFIWGFNVDDVAGSVALQDASGAAVTSGQYALTNGQLRLTGLVERHYQSRAGQPDTPSKDITYTVRRTENGRIVIGKKTYRQCTRAAPMADAPAHVSPGAINGELAPPERVPAQTEPSAPSEALTAAQACQRLETPVGEMIESNSQGALNVIEVSAVENYSRLSKDGTPACYGSIITNHGTLYGFFWVTSTPKGQSVLQWKIDEAATKIAN